MWAPFLGLAFAYWMSSSNQLTSNDWLNPITTASDVFQAQHLMQSIILPSGWANPSWPLLVTCFFVLACIFFGSPMMKLVEKCMPGCIIGDIEIDQDIDNYWKALDNEDREWSIKEEKNSRKRLGGMKIMTDDSWKHLKKAKENHDGKTLEGVHSYDILANPNYLESFQYVSASQPNRGDFIIDDDDNEDNDAAQSDLVRVVLGLAFIHNPKNFKFTSEALCALKKAHEATHHANKIQ